MLFIEINSNLFRSEAEKLMFTANLERARTLNECQLHGNSTQFVLSEYSAKSKITGNSTEQTIKLGMTMLEMNRI